MADLADPRHLAVAAALGHSFADRELLARACTHASRCGAQANAADKLRDANERLEFLGDALLGAATALLLYRRLPDADEGVLSRHKSRLVSRATLARAIEQLDLLRFCAVGANMGRSWPDSVKANLMEALLGAIYEDGGWPALATAVERTLAAFLDDPEVGALDERMRLQAWCLQYHRCLPLYHSERSGGSDHEPLFAAEASIAGCRASGTGSSRRRAEAAAAAALLARLAPPATPAGPPAPPA